MSTQQTEALPALIERFRGLHFDHAPDGWPAVRTREITALLDRITELESQLAQRFDAADMATAAQQAPAGVTLRSMIEGMSVSVDVSTGDHDAGHRYFGTVTEVMECQGDKHGVTLLVQDAEPNFAVPTPQAAQTAPAAQQAGATKEHVRLVRVIADKIEDGTLFRSGIYSNKDLARFVRNVADAAAPQPSPAAQADSVQEDAARYRWLRRWKGQEHEPPFTVQHEIDGTLWGGDLDAAIDAAMNKGGA